MSINSHITAMLVCMVLTTTVTGQNSKYWIKSNINLEISDNSVTNCEDLVECLTEFNGSFLGRAFPSTSSQRLSYIYEIECPDSNQNDIENCLSHSQYIDYIEIQPMIEFDIIPDDYSYQGSPLYHLELIEAQYAWDYIPPTFSKIKVAITDGAFNALHEDLQANITYIDNSAILTGSFHGNNVSGATGIVNNNNTGISSIGGYSAELMLYNSYINRMLEAAQDGARIINASWHTADNGSTESNHICTFKQTEQLVIDEIHDMGVIIIAAGGNSKCNANSTTPQYPAAYDHVIAVGATSPYDNREVYSSYYPAIDIAAPGNAIVTASQNGYLPKTGTSLSAPIVTGLAALVLSINPCLDPDAVEDILPASADLQSVRLTLSSSTFLISIQYPSVHSALHNS